VRGYADQRLRKVADPEDPSNRRISVIVQYLVKPESEKAAPAAADVAKAVASAATTPAGAKPVAAKP